MNVLQVALLLADAGYVLLIVGAWRFIPFQPIMSIPRISKSDLRHVGMFGCGFILAGIALFLASWISFLL